MVELIVMIVELIIMIGVIGWFARTARVRGQSEVLWGIIGGVSYYGPVLLFGFVIWPILVKGSLTADNTLRYTIAGMILNIAVGITFCLLARAILLSLPGGRRPLPGQKPRTLKKNHIHSPGPEEKDLTDQPPASTTLPEAGASTRKPPAPTQLPVKPPLVNAAILTCPKCKARVIPKADGTCPSCQHKLVKG